MNIYKIERPEYFSFTLQSPEGLYKMMGTDMYFMRFSAGSDYVLKMHSDDCMDSSKPFLAAINTVVGQPAKFCCGLAQMRIGY